MVHPDYLKTCPECRRQYEARRSDQVFCHKSCKNRHNNRKKRQEKQIITEQGLVLASSNTIVWQNRNILKAFEGQQVNIKELETQGFRHGYVTRFFTPKGENKTVFCCGEYAYKIVKKGIITIFKLQN